MFESTNHPSQKKHTQQVEADSLALHAIARRLRERRFANGALRLDNTRLYFTLDASGRPVAAAPYVQQEANQLVEEFMLLANMRVAGLISRAFPEHAVLRCVARVAFVCW
jgi:DIS3-like exonuclease 2